MLDLEKLINNNPEYKWIKRHRKRLCFIGVNDNKQVPEIIGVLLPNKTDLDKNKYDKYIISHALIYDLDYFNTESDVKEYIKSLNINQYLIFNEVGFDIDYSNFEINPISYEKIITKIKNNKIKKYKEPIKQTII